MIVAISDLKFEGLVECEESKEKSKGESAMYEKLFMTCGESNRDEGETYLLGVYLYVAKLGISVDPPAIKNPALYDVGIGILYEI